MKPPQHITVIINPVAGQDEPILNVLNRVFAEYDDMTWDVQVTQKQGNARCFAQEALKAGASVIAAYGGDGTQMEVASALVGTDTPLAVLPGGTGNALAAELGIPNNLEAAARLICQPERRIQSLDVGSVNENIFLLRIGTGLLADFSGEANREAKDRFGILAYVMAGLKAIRNPQMVNYTLTLDGEVVETEGVACMIANIGSLGGAINLTISKEVLPTDGLLDVFVVKGDLGSAVAALASVIDLQNFPLSLDHWQCREVTLHADSPQAIHSDGEEESFASTPITAKILPQALNVVVPRGDA